MLAVVYRPWSLSIEMVVETLPDDGHDGHNGEPKAAELLVVLARVVAVAHVGRVIRVSTYVHAFAARVMGR